MENSALEELGKRDEVWAKKATLRTVYADIYKRLIENAAEGGTTLEIGGGTGVGKQFLSGTISSDIIESPWTDVVCDAHSLPVKDGALDNIVMVDVLHHLSDPITFMKDAARALRPGGHLVMVEPAITPLSYPFYHWLHYEPVDMSADPTQPIQNDQTARDPLYDSNQGMPSLLFGKYWKKTAQLVPEFELQSRRHFSLWVYPLSGGYRPWSLIPAFMAGAVLKIERLLEPLIARFFGFRVLIVLRKKA